MKTRLLTAALIVLALLTLGFRQPRPSFEHRQTLDFREVQKLGSEGWELAAVEGGTVTTFYLKRAK